MCKVTRFFSFWRNLIRRKHVEQELSDEVADYLQLLIDAKLRDGYRETEARRAAMMDLGGVEQLKEQMREAKSGYRFESVLEDLRYAIRVLLKKRDFAVTAAVTLAVAIAVSIALFCLIQVTFFHPLNFPEPNRLFSVSADAPADGLVDLTISYPRFEMIRAQQNVFEDMAAFAGDSFVLTRAGVTQHLVGARVSARFFSVLGVEPRLGRFFSEEEDSAGKSSVVIVGRRLWENLFKSRTGVIGQRILLNGASYTIIGIAPELAAPFGEFEIFVPQVARVGTLSPTQVERGAGFLHVIGRAFDNVSLEKIRSALGEIDRQYREVSPNNLDAAYHCRVAELREVLVRDARPAFYVLAEGTGCLLLLAWINATNLLMARLIGRGKEVILRRAFGAGSRRILQQFLCEGLVLALAASAVAMVTAWFGLRILRAHSSAAFPQAEQLQINSGTILFTLLLTLLTGLVVGVVPAWRAGRAQLNESLKGNLSAAWPASQRVQIRTFLLVGQIAISLVILIADGLLLTSLRRLQDVDPGMNLKGVHLTEISLSPNDYPEDANRAAFLERLIDRVKSLPDVTGVTATVGFPLTPHQTYLPYARDDGPVELRDRPVGWYRTIAPNYFSTVAIPLRRGRSFTARDQSETEEVVIISETAARNLFSQTNPIGRTIVCGGTIQTHNRIVGVVGDVRSLDLTQPARGDLYFPISQRGDLSTTLVVRTSGRETNRGTLEENLRSCLAQLDPNQSMGKLQSAQGLVARSVAKRKVVTTLLTVFALLALISSATGIYGVMSCAVAERTQEIRIRIALGAGRIEIFRQFVGRPMKVAASGLGIGLICALVLTRSISSFLFGTSAFDPVVYCEVVLLFIAVSLLSSFLPAQRASRVTSLVALQCE